jgi:hypothetical protein
LLATAAASAKIVFSRTPLRVVTTRTRKRLDVSRRIYSTPFDTAQKDHS